MNERSSAGVEINWVMLDRLVEKAVREAYHTHFSPTVVGYNRTMDAVPAALIACRSNAVLMPIRLIQPRPNARILLVSVTNDEDITDVALALNNRLQRSYPDIRYDVKTMVIFDSGFPAYDYPIHPIPYEVRLPYRIPGDRGRPSQESTTASAEAPVSFDKE